MGNVGEIAIDIPLIVGSAFTLLIFFSYLLGDNLLYRWALALLAGSGIGYAFAIALRFLFNQWIPLAREGQLQPVVVIPPLVLGLLLLSKLFPRISPLGNVAMALILGVGAAVAVSGALLGTLFPQISATGAGLSGKEGTTFLEGALALAGTILALLSFSSKAAKPKEEINPIALWAYRLGRAVVAIALAAVFAGAITSGLTVLIDRLWVIADFAGVIVKELINSGG